MLKEHNGDVSEMSNRRLVVAVASAPSRTDGDEAGVDELLDLLCDYWVPEMPVSTCLSVVYLIAVIVVQ